MHMKEFCRGKILFYNFKIRNISKAQNIMTDKFLYGTKNFPVTMLYVDSIPSNWFSDLVSS